LTLGLVRTVMATFSTFPPSINHIAAFLLATSLPTFNKVSWLSQTQSMAISSPMEPEYVVRKI
jgi:hypothetical protein